MKNKTDVIVVGGGPAGISAAVTIARAGKKVVLIERGNFSGSKNVFGGAIYAQPTKEIFPNFEETAPLERKIVNHKYALFTEGESVTVSYYTRKKDEIPNSYSVIRAKFDRWMAQEAENEGVVIVTETLVKDVLKEGKKVVGVRTELETYYSDIVILADGVNSILAKQIGLREEIKTKDVALAIKEVLKLDKDLIEARFALNEGEGAVYEFMGEPIPGILGLSYVYTNKETISIGMGVSLDEMVKRKIRPNELVDKLRNHSSLAPFLKGAELVEYSAHLIPEGGYKKIPKLFSEGVMVVGDSAMLVNNLHWEGTNLAMISGKLAGETAVEAFRKNDFSANMLSLYQKKLEQSFVLKDLKTYKDVFDIVHSRSASFLGYYPKKIASFMGIFTKVDSIPKRDKYRAFIKSYFTDRGIIEIFKDAWAFIRLVLGVIK